MTHLPAYGHHLLEELPSLWGQRDSYRSAVLEVGFSANQSLFLQGVDHGSDAMLRPVEAFAELGRRHAPAMHIQGVHRQHPHRIGIMLGKLNGHIVPGDVDKLDEQEERFQSGSVSFVHEQEHLVNIDIVLLDITFSDMVESNLIRPCRVLPVGN